MSSVDLEIFPYNFIWQKVKKLYCMVQLWLKERKELSFLLIDDKGKNASCSLLMRHRGNVQLDRAVHF